MKFELKQYRLLHLSYDELCVAAAFLNIPCLYGISGRWMKTGHDSLAERVKKISGRLERKGLILPEISGVVRMSTAMYEQLQGMSSPDCMGRISYSFEKHAGKIYVYGKDARIVFMEQDGKGGCYLGTFSSVQEFLAIFNRAKGTKREEMLEKPWMTILLFEKKDCFYSPLLDFAWTEGEEDTTRETLSHGWKEMGRLLESSSTRRKA